MLGKSQIDKPVFKIIEARDFKRATSCDKYISIQTRNFYKQVM